MSVGRESAFQNCQWAKDVESGPNPKSRSPIDKSVAFAHAYSHYVLI